MTIFQKLLDYFESVTTQEHCHVVVVKNGDNLTKIAKELGHVGPNDYQELVAANPERRWTSDYMVHPGDTLNIPKHWVTED